jgi:hypothetical protein
MKTRDILILGGAGLVALYLLQKNQNTSGTSTGAGTLSPSIASQIGDVLSGNQTSLLSGNTASLSANLNNYMEILSRNQATISPAFTATVGDIASGNTANLQATLQNYLNLLSGNTANTAASLFGGASLGQAGVNPPAGSGLSSLSPLSLLQNWLGGMMGGQNAAQAPTQAAASNRPGGFYVAPAVNPYNIQDVYSYGVNLLSGANSSGITYGNNSSPASVASPWTATQTLSNRTTATPLGAPVANRQAVSQPSNQEIASRLARGLM